MRKAIALTAVSAALLLFGGCKDDRPASTTTTTGAAIVRTENAVDRLAVRRCDRETDCKNVGAGKRYEDRGACERELLHSLEVELGPEVCSYGVREERLNECLESIRVESCQSSLDTISRLATCRTHALCIGS
jgi:hypothetical protein